MVTHDCSDQHVRACRASRHRTTEEKGENILSLLFNTPRNFRHKFSSALPRVCCRSAWVTGLTQRRVHRRSGKVRSFPTDWLWMLCYFFGCPTVTFSEFTGFMFCVLLPFNAAARSLQNHPPPTHTLTRPPWSEPQQNIQSDSSVSLDRRASVTLNNPSVAENIFTWTGLLNGRDHIT